MLKARTVGQTWRAYNAAAIAVVLDAIEQVDGLDKVFDLLRPATGTPNRDADQDPIFALHSRSQRVDLASGLSVLTVMTAGEALCVPANSGGGNEVKLFG